MASDDPKGMLPVSTRFTDNPRQWGIEETDLIRKNGDLTEAAKKRRIAEVQYKVRDEIQKRNRETAEREQARVDAALRPILKPPGGHSAESRALLAQLQKDVKTSEQAERELREATVSGDDLKVWALRAIAADNAASPIPKAAEKWFPLLEEQASRDSEFARHMNELTEAKRAVRSPARRLMDSMMPAIDQKAEREMLAHRAQHPDGDDERADLTPRARRAQEFLDVVFKNRSVG